MSRAFRLAMAPWRLARAIRLKGLGPVSAFLLRNVKARGGLGAFRAALLDRDERAALDANKPVRLTTGVATGSVRTPPEGGFARSRTLSVAEWGNLNPARGPDAEKGRSTPSAPLLFVIRGEAGSARDVTREAIRRLEGVDISEALIAGREPPASEQFVVFLEAGDLPSTAIGDAIASATERGVTDVVSFDLIMRDEDRVVPLSFPGANPTLLQTSDYLFGRVALRGEALGLSMGGDASARTRMLAWMQDRPALETRGRWRHVGVPLVETVLRREDITKAREDALLVGRLPIPESLRRAAVVICTKDRGFLLDQLVRALLAKPVDLVVQVVIVANGTTNPYALQAQSELARLDRVRVVRDDRPFNFSRLCNEAVRDLPSDADLLFLNDDIVPITPDWLERLLYRLEDEAVAVAGPLLLYPDETVQHAGMYLGLRGVAGHTLRGARLPDDDYLLTACAPREAAAVTGAVLLVRREAFHAVNGFDKLLPTLAQDVDLCVRLRDCGWAIVFDPTAVLLHMESVSILHDDEAGTLSVRRRSEEARYLSRWTGALADPLHPAIFDPQDESMRRLRPEWIGAAGPQTFRARKV